MMIRQHSSLDRWGDHSNRTHSYFSKYTSFVILYTIFVISWGAYVRASSSGAGCGSHWPLCNGQFFPLAPTLKTFIEFSHRITSGMSLILVLANGVWTFNLFPRGTFIRKVATIGVLSILLEALIGAGLVLFELVYKDQSAKRALSIIFHFTNTLVLLGALTLTKVSAARQGEGANWNNFKTRREAYFFTLIFFFIGMAGAITALGDTLFPSASLLAGLKKDLDHSSHFLVKLRVIHPFLAITFVGLVTPWITAKMRELACLRLHRIGTVLICLLVGNLILGVVNMVWLAPIIIQMVHLLVAMSIWITFVLFLDQVAYEE